MTQEDKKDIYTSKCLYTCKLIIDEIIKELSNGGNKLD